MGVPLYLDGRTMQTNNCVRDSENKVINHSKRLFFDVDFIKYYSNIVKKACYSITRETLYKILIQYGLCKKVMLIEMHMQEVANHFKHFSK
jgi:hypothetical protein